MSREAACRSNPFPFRICCHFKKAPPSRKPPCLCHENKGIFRKFPGFIRGISLQNIAKDSHAHQRALSSFRIQSGIGAFRDILRFRHANSPQNILVFIYPRIRETHLSQTAAIEPSIFLKNTICQDIPRAPLQSQAAFRQSSHESAFETLQEPVKVSSGIYQSVLGYADSITAASSAQSEMTGAPNERQTSAKRPPIPARRLLPRHIPHMKGFLLSILFRTALFERPSFKRPPLRASLHASLL